MTKHDLVVAIYEELNITKNEASELLEGLLDIIKTTLEGGEDLKIANFGKFEVRQKKARVGRNPQTGKAITIASRQIITFKSSVLLRKCINDGCGMPGARPLRRRGKVLKDGWQQGVLPL